MAFVFPAPLFAHAAPLAAPSSSSSALRRDRAAAPARTYRPIMSSSSSGVPPSPHTTPTPAPSKKTAQVSGIKSPIPTTTSRDTYDYIIVGGGAAGCVLANRLSAQRHHRVLLVETGDRSESFILNMPLGFPKLLGSSLDVALTTSEEPELNNRRLYFPRGRLLGGSHAISVMLYHRGDKNDYNKWADLCNDPQWAADSVLPYFLKSQNQHSDTLLAQNPDQHSTKGSLDVDDLQFVNPISKAFVQSSRNVGVSHNSDFNNWNDDQEGVGLFQVTQKDGNRATPATCYLNPVRGRSNLTIMPSCTVERIVFDSSDASHEPIASAIVLVDSDGRRVEIKATREIVLSAGVYGSPQLLMLSGIGAQQDLSQFGIQAVHHNEYVGQNLQDHVASMLTFYSPDPYADKKKTSTYYSEDTGKDMGIILNYLMNGKGPLTSPMCEAGAFLRTVKDRASKSCDLQIRFIPFFSEPDPYGSLASFANGGSYLRNDANRPAGFSLQSVATRPSSKGYVKLRSVDVRDSLHIFPNWISDRSDLDTLIAGIKLCRQIADDPALAAFKGKEMHPGLDTSTDDQLEQYIRETCHTANAMVGTCAMGNQLTGVVDSNLRVKGVQRLRVVDSSVMPTLPGGQSGAPTMMIAEKGADLIINAATPARLQQTSTVN